MAKSDAEIALEKRYDLLRKQRAGVAAGPGPPGPKRVGDQRMNAVSASSSRETPAPSGAGAPEDAPAGAQQEPMTAFERTKLILAQEAEKKRREAEKRAAHKASSNRGGATDAIARAPVLEEKQTALPALGRAVPKTPSLKRPAARALPTAGTGPRRNERPRGGDDDDDDEGDAGGAPETFFSVDPDAPRVVFVADLPEACATETVASALYRFGNVEEVRIVEHRDFGFVTFANPAGAAKAVLAARADLEKVRIGGRVIKVDFARADRNRDVRGGNEKLYAVEIKNKAMEMVGLGSEETDARVPPGPQGPREAWREMVTYDDI